MKKISSLLFLACLFSSLTIPSPLFAAARGINVSVKTTEGEEIDLYRDSFALVIGNGNYKKDWDPLPGAIRDAEEVAAALKRNGFKVTLKTDLTREAFNRALGEFVLRYGKDGDNRLLFYYAGHGHTQKMATGEELGYLVMIDAPVPEKDPVGFSLASVDMQALLTQAKMIRSKHALFMFDSCFSGTVLNMRDRVTPSAISDKVRYPVRQFITAGRANETVPDRSVFKESFLDILDSGHPGREGSGAHSGWVPDRGRTGFVFEEQGPGIQPHATPTVWQNPGPQARQRGFRLRFSQERRGCGGKACCIWQGGNS
jgi:uncharacterized caspase-like protein